MPAALRQQLGLNSGDRLDADLVDGAIVLRPAAKAKHLVPRKGQKAAIDPPAPGAPGAPALTDVAPARRKPGRPRKVDTADELTPPAPKRPRGRPKAVRAPQTEAAPVPAVSSEPWKLLRKEDLQPKVASAEHAPLPNPRLPRARHDPGSPGEEGHPFRNVEVRKLGPGRQHNRPRAFSWAVRLPT